MGSRKDPKRDAKREKLTALLQQRDVYSMQDINALFKYMIGSTQLSTYFKHPPEIRKAIYTTNAIENHNRRLRKVTKTRTIFPTDDALCKLLHLAMMDITKKWTGRPANWGMILQ